MKRSALALDLQGNLPLADTPALSIPQQRELALALMELLIQAARQFVPARNNPNQGVPHE